MSDTWIDVDLDKVVQNFREVQGMKHSAAKVMAVVKADGYGLGAVQVALALAQAGCEAFAVTTVEEGLILRQEGLGALILVLGPAGKDDLEGAIEADLQLTLSALEMVPLLQRAAEKTGRKARVHIKLETGMGRTGFLPSELEPLAESLQEAPMLLPVGVYTHLARAAQRDTAYTREQYQRFAQGIGKLETLGIKGLYRHVCNSAAFLDYPEWHHDYVRIGTLLIGHFPSPAFAGRLKLQDPWLARTRVVQVKCVPKGTFVGYQSLYRTRSETQLAVIPVGYADGFGIEPHFVPQGLWDFIKIVIKNLLALLGYSVGKETVKMKGQTVRVAGKIGMQLTVLDVGNAPCRVGEEVVIPLRRTLTNPRLVRQYWQGGVLVGKRSLREVRLPQETSTKLCQAEETV